MTARPRVVHLTSVHPPFDSRIFHRECKWLARNGYDVTLVVPAAESTERDGVRVSALPVPSGRLSRTLVTAPRILLRARRERADLYHLHDPELLPVGTMLRIAGKRVVYDAHEDVPKAIMSRHWIPHRLRSLVAQLTDWVETHLAGMMSGVVSATPFIAERFQGVDVTAVVQNFPDPEELTAIPVDNYAQRAGVLAYAGSISEIRGCMEMIAAIALVDPGLDVRLHLAGKFATAETRRIAEAMPGFERCVALGWLDRAALRTMYASARAGLAVIQPVPNLINAYPVKLFEYMAAGLPVVASNFPVYREIVETAECGILVDPTAPAEIARAIESLLRDPAQARAMGLRGREAVLSRYSWGSEFRKLVDLYSRVLQT